MDRTSVEVVDKLNYLKVMSYNLTDRFEFSGFGLEGSCLPICTMSSQKELTLRRLMSYIYGAPILDVSRSHTTTQHSR